MLGPLDIHRLLLAADVPHEVVQLPRRVAAAEEIAEALGVPSRACAVVHVVFADSSPHAIVLAAGARWSPARLAAVLKAVELRVADPAETSAVTQYSAGLVSPLALPAGLPVLVDAALAAGEMVYLPTGETATALKMRTRDLLTATGALVDALAEPPSVFLAATPHEGRPVHFVTRAG